MEYFLGNVDSNFLEIFFLKKPGLIIGSFFVDRSNNMNYKYIVYGTGLSLRKKY